MITGGPRIFPSKMAASKLGSFSFRDSEGILGGRNESHRGPFLGRGSKWMLLNKR